MKINTVLLRNFFVVLPDKTDKTRQPNTVFIGTILQNLLVFGYTLTTKAIDILSQCDDETLIAWYQHLEITIREFTGANKNMADHVVYKNFPAEVLEKTQAEYWVAQILMYIGVPSKFFTEAPKERQVLSEITDLICLKPVDENTYNEILQKELLNPVKWTPDIQASIETLLNYVEFSNDYTSKIINKENLMVFYEILLKKNIDFKLKNPTDLLRLANQLSKTPSQTLRNTSKIKFISFPRKTRKFFIKSLESFSLEILGNEIAKNKNEWKKFLYVLHPGNYSWAINTRKVYDQLINNVLPKTFNGQVEQLIISKDESVLALLSNRPGEYARRLHQLILLFGIQAIEVFPADKLTVYQLLKLEKYFTVPQLDVLVVVPKGNYSKTQLIDNNKEKISSALLLKIRFKIFSALKAKLQNEERVYVDESAQLIHLPNGENTGFSIGKGTCFPIPENIDFIRTATYWKALKQDSNIWFDNGWNFFDEKWEPKGVCCWNAPKLSQRGVGTSACFSGDPCTNQTSTGEGCQLIDLYLDKLVKSGITYAVWNVLSYNSIPFNQREVFVALQWGKDANSGKLFEPSRSQISFDLKSSGLTNQIAYLDLKKRQLVYIDISLKSDVRSANSTSAGLQKLMPYLSQVFENTPTVWDLMSFLHDETSENRVLYTDKDIEIKSQNAWVYKPVNPNNEFKQIDLNNLLNK